MSNTPSDINSNEITPDKPITTTTNNQYYYALLSDLDDDNVQQKETKFRDFVGPSSPFHNLDSRELLPDHIDQPILSFSTIPPTQPFPCIGPACLQSKSSHQ